MTAETLPGRQGVQRVQFTREVTNAQTIRSYEPGRIRIGEAWFTRHLIVTREQIIEPWHISDPSDITKAQLAPALAHDPKILLIGTGTRYVMCDTELIGELARLGIGTEIMDTAAACRTFNVLVHEQRPVVAALYNA
jgi:uncharacterized protein